MQSLLVALGGQKREAILLLEPRVIIVENLHNIMMMLWTALGKKMTQLFDRIAFIMGAASKSTTVERVCRTLLSRPLSRVDSIVVILLPWRQNTSMCHHINTYNSEQKRGRRPPLRMPEEHTHVSSSTYLFYFFVRAI